MLRKDTQQYKEQAEGKSASLGKILIGTAASFLAWGIGMKVARGVSHLINRKAGVAIANWAYNNKSGLNRFVQRVFTRTGKYIRESGLAKDRVKLLKQKLEKTRNIYSKLRGQAKHAINKMSAQYLDETIGYEHTRYFMPRATKMITPLGEKLPAKTFARIHKKDIRATSIFWNTSYVKKHNFLKKIRNIRASKALAPMGDYFAPATHAKYKMGGSKFHEALQSRIYRYATTMLATAPVEYSVMRMMDTQSEDKWYSPRAIGSWMKYTVMGDLTMGYLPGKIFGAIGRHAAGAFKIRSQKGANFVHKVLSAADKVSNSAMVLALHKTATFVKYHKDPINKPHGVKSSIDWMRKVVHQFRHEFMAAPKELERRRAQSVGRKMTNEAISFLKLVDQQDSDQSVDVIAQMMTIHHNIGQNLRKHDPNKWLKKINWIFSEFDDKIKGSRSHEISETMEKVGFEIPRPKRTQEGFEVVAVQRREHAEFHDSIEHPKGEPHQYYHPHKGMVEFQGKQYDLSNITPHRFMRSVNDILSGVQIFGLRPFKLLGAGPFFHTGDMYKMHRYRKGDIVTTGPMINPDKLTDLPKFINETPDYRSNNTLSKIKYKVLTLKEAKNRGTGVSDWEEHIHAATVYKGDIAAQEEAARIMMRKRLGHLDTSNINSRSAIDTITSTKYQLAVGKIKLIDNEEIIHIGKQLYYIPDATAKNPTMYQVGADWQTGKFPLIDIVPKEHVGSLGVIDDTYYGVQPYVKTKMEDGKYERVSTGIGTKSPKSKVRPDDTWFMHSVHKFMDYFDLGTYEHSSIVNVLGHFSRRFKMAKEPRKYFSEDYLFNQDLRTHVSNTAASNTKKTFVNLTKNHIRKMHSWVIDQVFSNDKVISSLSDHEYDFLLQQHIEGSSLIDVLGKLKLKVKDPFLGRTIDDMGSNIYSTMVKNGKDIKVKRSWRQLSRYLSEEEWNVLNLIESEKPLDIVTKLSLTDTNEAIRDILTKFKTISAKVKLASLNDAELDAILGEVKRNQTVGSIKKMATAFDLVKMFNKEIDGENILDDIRLNKDYHNMMQYKMNRLFTIMDEHADSLKTYARYADPIWKLRGSPNVRLYGGGGTTGDVFLSTNKTESGEYVRSFWDTFLPKTIRTDEGWDVPDGMLTKTGALTMAAVHAVNNTAAFLGLGFNLENMRTPTMFMKNIVTKRVLPALGLAAAWQVADTVVDGMPLFEGTGLQNGLNAFVANQVATARLSIARFNDVTGITDSARYLENLLPGSINSPLSAAVRGFGVPLLGSALGAMKGGPKGGLLGGAIGLGLSLITAGGPVDFMTGGHFLTKRRKDIIEEYAGRKMVPHYRQSGWLISSSPFSGGGIDAFLPSWYARVHTDYMHTDVMYGSKFEELINTFSPTHYFEKHKYTRPYPFSGGFLENVPIVGSVLSFGGEMGDYPELQMAAGIGDGDISYAPSMETLGLMSGYNDMSLNRVSPTVGFTGDPNSGMIGGVRPMKPTSLPAKIQQTMYQSTELFGLRGFLTQTMLTEFNEGMFPYETTPMFQSAALMTSPGRAYWDAMPSDPLSANEFVRRFLPHRGEHVSEWNNLVNAQPDWMPQQFRTGDAFCVSGDTLIEIGKLSFKRADTVKTTDKLITHKNNEVHPSAIVKRKVGKRERTYDVRIEGLPFIPYKFSEEHPILVVNDEKKEYLTRPKATKSKHDIISIIRKYQIQTIVDISKHIDVTYSQISTYVAELIDQGYIRKDDGYYKVTKDVDMNISENDFEFRMVRDLKVGDIVVYPTPKINEEELVIDIADLLPHYTYTDKYVYLFISKKHALLYEFFEEQGTCYFGRNPNKLNTRKVREMFDIDNRGIYEYTQYLYRQKKVMRMPRYIKATPNIMYLFGLYLAEGYTGPAMIGICGHVQETNTRISRIKKALDDFGINEHITVTRNSTRGNGETIAINSKLMSELFVSIFGKVNAHTKYIPEWFSKFGKELLLDLFKGFMDGDGCFFYDKPESKRIPTYSITSCNMNLLLQLRRILSSFGIYSTMTKYKAKRDILPGEYNMKYGIRGGVAYHLLIRGHNADKLTSIMNGQSLPIPNYMFYRVKNINIVNDVEYVYGFEVNGDDSFCVLSFATHNTKIRLGEARLPGAGLEALRNIKFTIPLEAEYIGQTAEEQLKYMTGNHMPVDPNERFTKLLGGKMAQQVANTISSMNNNVKMNEYVFNPMLNMSGKFDVVVNNTSGMKIKVVTPDTFERLQGPRPQDAGEMNALLNIGRSIKHGTIVYVNAATGETQEFQMSADPTRFHEDVQRTMHVRSTALNMIKEKGSEVGKAGLGYAYSRVDRLMVLADVGMNSPEYRETLKEVNELDKRGMLSPEDRQKVYVAITQVARKRDQFQYKERKFTRGTPATEQEEIYQAAIKHEYGKVERAIGKVWEDLTFRQTMGLSRFLYNKTPIDVYRENYVYGDGPVRQWQNPYSDFIRPYTMSALNRDSITQSISSMAAGGFVVGGPVGAGLGAMAGAAWWAVHGKETVPEYTKRRSEVLKELDKVEYLKDQQAIAMGDVSAQYRIKKTMTYALDNATSIDDMVQSLPKTEREFVKHFVNAGTVEERERIMRLVPDYAQYVLKKAWSTGTNAYKDQLSSTVSGNPMTEVEAPSWQSAVFDPTVSSADIKVKVLENEGYNARAVGLGFQAQKRRLIRNPYVPEDINQTMKVAGHIDPNNINMIIKSILPGAQVTTMATQTPGVKLIVKGNFISKSYQQNYIRTNYGG